MYKNITIINLVLLCAFLLFTLYATDKQCNEELLIDKCSLYVDGKFHPVALIITYEDKTKKSTKKIIYAWNQIVGGLLVQRDTVTFDELGQSLGSSSEIFGVNKHLVRLPPDVVRLRPEYSDSTFINILKRNDNTRGRGQGGE